MAPSPGRARAERRVGIRRCATLPGARDSGRSHAMPNIKQQKKRVRSAERERLENRRYRSTVKTLFRRLETAIEEGDETAAATEHRLLVRWIDKAAARGALHRNTAARRKATAARLLGRRS